VKTKYNVCKSFKIVQVHCTSLPTTLHVIRQYRTATIFKGGMGSSASVVK